MKHINSILSAAFTIFAISISGYASEEDGFRPLFDGNTLEGWTSARSEKEGDWGPFSINQEEKAVHVYAGSEQGSKQVTDCLNTKEQFSHYILRLEYKWLENRFAPRTEWDRDAGLLFHVHGDLRKVWPHSLEMQIGETPRDTFKKRRFHTGDLFVLGKHLRVQSKRKDNIWDPDGQIFTGRSGPTRLGVEKPKGEWNEMEIRVHGSEKATFILNGEIVYEIMNMEQQIGKNFVPLEKGHIGLQAEWAELLYRNIRIKELPAQ